MNHYLVLIFFVFISYVNTGSMSIYHWINTFLKSENTSVRSITDPTLVFSAAGVGTMDNLSTTTSIVDSGTLSVTGTSTLGTVTASSLSLSSNETVTGTLSVAGIATLGTINASSLSLSGNETITGNLTINGPFAPSNINLVDSTATAGNITKVGTRFITNFGTNNTFIGKGSGNFTLTTANAVQNTALGALALSGLVGTATSLASSNTAIGYNAAPSITDGSNNTALGQGTLPAVTTGSSNIAIGSGAGSVLTTGSNNVYIASPGLNESGTIRIGTSGTHTSAVIVGTVFLPGLGTTILPSQGIQWDSTTGQLLRLLSSKAFKTNIQPINDEVIEKFLQLEPVSYSDINDTREYPQIIYGFIAEDVNDIMPDLIILNEEGKPSSISYAMMYPLLLKLIQRHERIITDQSNEILLLNREIEFLKNQNNTNKKKTKNLLKKQ